ncbi:uncharacterized protein LOC110917056 isoform X1 [Helianthus annuus]|uniref:uncharacterized protein LOC110917056 isoform X1 n=1 Tax=Helianthus annuus TaxID=4232 RepID=UPI001652B9F4|nr:uncharacterized protein LOC110917056 isoform X1 [Helianthus annuus]
MVVSTVSTRRTSGPVIRSHFPSRTTSFASTSQAFSTESTSFFRNRSESHTPAYRTMSSSSSVRFSLDNRPISPSRSISSPVRNHNQAVKKTCMCSPTMNASSWEDATKFLTGASAMGSVAIPVILKHAGVITWGAFAMEISSLFVFVMAILCLTGMNSDDGGGYRMI